MAPVYDDGRPFRQERRRWPRPQYRAKLRAEKGLDITDDRARFSLPNAPGRVLDVVLHRPSVSLRHIAPVMLGYEFRLGALAKGFRSAAGHDFKGAFQAPVAPT